LRFARADLDRALIGHVAGKAGAQLVFTDPQRRAIGRLHRRAIADSQRRGGWLGHHLQRAARTHKPFAQHLADRFLEPRRRLLQRAARALRLALCRRLLDVDAQQAQLELPRRQLGIFGIGGLSDALLQDVAALVFHRELALAALLLETVLQLGRLPHRQRGAQQGVLLAARHLLRGVCEQAQVRGRDIDQLRVREDRRNHAHHHRARAAR
jgi:hypothetical protein